MAAVLPSGDKQLQAANHRFFHLSAGGHRMASSSAPTYKLP